MSMSVQGVTLDVDEGQTERGRRAVGGSASGQVVKIGNTFWTQRRPPRPPPASSVLATRLAVDIDLRLKLTELSN